MRSPTMAPQPGLEQVGPGLAEVSARPAHDQHVPRPALLHGLLRACLLEELLHGLHHCSFLRGVRGRLVHDQWVRTQMLEVALVQGRIIPGVAKDVHGHERRSMVKMVPLRARS